MHSSTTLIEAIGADRVDERRDFLELLLVALFGRDFYRAGAQVNRARERYYRSRLAAAEARERWLAWRAKHKRR
jgi:hypothetical protein